MSDLSKLSLPSISRRKALFGALFSGLGAVGGVSNANAAGGVDCSCLPPPDCNAICPNGGAPKGDGTQACACFENPKTPEGLAQVAYTGDWNDLINRPPRAGSSSDGGAATNSERWGGKLLRLNHNTSDTWIPVFSGNYVDYILKSELGGGGQIGAKNFSAKVAGFTVTASRDAYGRLSNFYASGNCVTPSNCSQCQCACQDFCNCNCDCQCGDDGGCFIQANLKTKDGYKAIDAVKEGDILIGPDGEHCVVGVAKNSLGNRRAVSLKDDPNVILTEEHIVNKSGKSFVFSKDFSLSSLIESENGVQGRYISIEAEASIEEAPEEFNIVDLLTSTITYTPIVEKTSEKQWVFTENGSVLLLATQH